MRRDNQFSPLYLLSALFPGEVLIPLYPFLKREDSDSRRNGRYKQKNALRVQSDVIDDRPDRDTLSAVSGKAADSAGNFHDGVLACRLVKRGHHVASRFFWRNVYELRLVWSSRRRAGRGFSVWLLLSRGSCPAGL